VATGPVVISILADARNAVRGFRTASTEAQTMGQKVKGAAGKMSGPALAALGGIGAAAFKAAQDASELGDSFDANKIIFGNATKDIQVFAASAAKNMGLSKQAVVDAANAIGTFGSAAGLKGSDLSKFTTELVGRAGDVASMFGGTATEATEAFGGALRGEFEGIRKYGVLLDDNTIKAKAMALGLVKASGNATQIKAANLAVSESQAKVNEATEKFGPTSTQAQKAQVGLEVAQARLAKEVAGTVPALTAQQKTLAIQSAILDSTSKAQNNFKDTSSSAKNQQEILKANLANTTAELGTALLPALSAVTGALGSMAAWGGKNATAVKVMVGVVGGLAAAVLIVNGAMRVAAAGQAIWTGAATAWSWIQKQNIVSTYAAAVATKVSMAAQVAWGAVTKVGTAIQAALNFVMAMNPIGLVIIAIVALVAVFVIAYKKSETFRRIVNAAWEGIKAGAVFVFEFLKKYIMTVIGIYVWIFKKGIAGVVAVWDGIKAIYTKVIDFRNKVIGYVVGLVSQFLNIGKNIMGALRDGIAAGIEWVKDKVKGLGALIPDWIKDVLGISSPSKVMVGIGAQIVAGLTKGIGGQVPALRRQLSGVSGVIASGITASPAVDLGAVQISGGGAPGAAAAPIVVNVYVSPLADPTDTGREITKALNAFARSRGLAPVVPVAI
jgi:hypothetical protein